MQDKLEELHKILYSEKSKQYMFLALCTTVFVYGFMYRIIEFNDIFWCSIPFCLYYIFEDRKKNPFDINFIMIFSATLVIANIAFMREPWLNIYWSDVKLVWLFPMVYLLGNASVGNNSRKAELRTLYILSFLNFGMFFQAVLDHLNRFFEPRTERTWYSFWKDDYEASTVFDIGFLMMVSSLFFAFKNRKNNRYLFIATVIGTVVCIMFSLWSGGRTTTLMCGVILLINFGFDILTNHSRYSKYKGFLLIFSVIALVIIIGFTILFRINFGGIYDRYSNSMLGRDGGIIHNVRIQIAIQSLKDAINVPQGGWYGSELLKGGGSHNTWLEFARRYNTIIFVIILLYALNTLKNSLIIMLKEQSDLKYLLVGAIFSMFIYMNMEPVGANPSYYYIIFYIFISGIINKFVYTRL